MQCRSHAAQLGRLYPEIQALGGEILLILGDTPERAAQYAQSLRLPYPVLADPERSVYHTYGLEKVFLFIQRTASLVIDRQGIIRYLKATANTMSWLDESHDLINFLRTMP